MIRVVLFGAKRIVREGLESLLSHTAGIAVVGSYASGGEMLAALPSLVPDVAVLETASVDGAVSPFIAQIHRASPGTRVIVLTDSHASGDLVVALRAGVAGYLSQEGSAGDLIAAIRDDDEGNFHVSSAAGGLIKDLALGTGGCPLTSRETEVLIALRDGLRTSEIATRLCLSASTVKTHLGSIYRKLDARNRVEATQEAERRGILSSR